MLKSIHHAALICSDYEKFKQFHLSILGLEIIPENYREERDSFKLDLKLPDGGQIELFSFANLPGKPRYPETLGLRHLAFNIQSVELIRD